MITKARKNISSAKASSGPIDGQSTEPLAQNQNKKGVRPWTFLFLLGLVLIVFALIYVWTQRYNLIEAHIEKLATKMGRGRVCLCPATGLPFKAGGST